MRQRNVARLGMIAVMLYGQARMHMDRRTGKRLGSCLQSTDGKSHPNLMAPACCDQPFSGESSRHLWTKQLPCGYWFALFDKVVVDERCVDADEGSRCGG